MSRRTRIENFYQTINEKYFQRIIKFAQKSSTQENIQSLIYNYNNLTLELIPKIPNKNWSLLSGNPNLSLEWLEKYPDKDWIYSDITLSNSHYYNQKCREYLAAYRIQ